GVRARHALGVVVPHPHGHEVADVVDVALVAVDVHGVPLARQALADGDAERAALLEVLAGVGVDVDDVAVALDDGSFATATAGVVAASPVAAAAACSQHQRHSGAGG